LIEIGRDVCSWHLADIDTDPENVRFEGAKRISRVRALASAHDPQQTSRIAEE
jgi:hypothetical protein